jgi:YD repeat-containing protein
VTKTDRNGVVTTFAYDAAGQLVQKLFSDATPDVSFGYDDAGRVTSAASSVDALNWTYDLAGQII